MCGLALSPGRPAQTPPARRHGTRPGGRPGNGLDRYARRFAMAGMAVLVFDYRGFGASGGEPRQVINIARQREDWHAAIAYARTIRGIDATRIALWGSSFGGGHVLSVAPDDHYIAAVVAQCPFTSGWSSAMAKGPISLTKTGTIALTDMIIGPIIRKPIKARLAGKKHSAALMSAADVPEGFGRLAEESSQYRPKVAARVGVSTLFDSPPAAPRTSRRRCSTPSATTTPSPRRARR
ncbi:hypothetical protein Ntsu_55600 [Nocardia sp. IFM 10818]